MSARSFALFGMSSTTRIRGGVFITRTRATTAGAPGGAGTRLFRSPARCRGRAPAVDEAVHLGDELARIDRLGEIAVEVGGHDPLSIGLHGGGRHGENRYRGGFAPVAELADRSQTIDTGELDVQDHQRR